jgi:hypothetical protein
VHQRLRGTLTYSRVVATLALFVALGGSSFAAPARDAAKHLISGKSIKNNSISSSDIKNNSVGSKDIKNGSLLKKDFKAGQLPAGPRGPAGPAGGTGRLTYLTSGFETVNAGDSPVVKADCPVGQWATGGAMNVNGPPDTQVVFEGPIVGATRGAWGATVSVPPGGNDASADVFVSCAPGPRPDDSHF